LWSHLQSFKSWSTKSALAASAAFSSAASWLVGRALIIVSKAALPFLLSVPSSSISLSQDIELQNTLETRSAFLLRAPSRSSTALTVAFVQKAVDDADDVGAVAVADAELLLRI
jgi:hypothetical protein